MNKTELAEAVAEAADLSKAKAGEAVNAVIAGISDALANGDSVSLIGFGTFSVKDRPERTGKNPKTGEPLTIAAHKAPHFKAGKGLKDAVN